MRNQHWENKSFRSRTSQTTSTAHHRTECNTCSLSGEYSDYVYSEYYGLTHTPSVGELRYSYLIPRAYTIHTKSKRIPMQLPPTPSY